jgi:hypothetical protein
VENFIKQNGLVKRLGLDEWYSADGMTRLVKIGDRYRLDVRDIHLLSKKSMAKWATFRSDYIVGHREREFKSVAGKRRW